MGRRLGQHFLNDPAILDRIVGALDPQSSDTVIEIGPGKGSLTGRLAPRVGRVIAIEKDPRLAAALRDERRETGDERRETGDERRETGDERRETGAERRETGAGGQARLDNLTVVQGDALEIDWHEVIAADDSSLVSRLPSLSFKVVGNIPYYITSPLLEKALEPPRPEVAVFLVQREVADRIVAAAGSREYGALTVGIQAVCRAERLFLVKAGAFTPPPEVDSAVVRLTPLATPLVSEDERLPFRRFVSRLFSQRRKQIGGSIRELFGMDRERVTQVLAGAGVKPEARAEVIDPSVLVSLFRALVPR